jgi:hypothetical protein
MQTVKSSLEGLAMQSAIKSLPLFPPSTSRLGLIGLKKFKIGALVDNYGGVTEFQPILLKFKVSLITQILKIKITTLSVEMKLKLELKLQLNSVFQLI